MNRVGLILVAVALSGCGHASESEDSKDALKAIGFRYHSFSHAHKRPPHHLQEFAEFTDPAGDSLMNANLQSIGDAALAGGDFVINWSADITGTSEDRSRILAYHKDVPEHGGYVCYGIGEVKKLTAEEFAAEPQASSDNSAKPEPHSSVLPSNENTPSSDISPRTDTDDHQGESAEGRIQEDIRQFINAKFVADANTVVAFTHPKLVDEMGGEQMARASVKAALLRMRKVVVIKLESVSFPEPAQFINAKSTQYAIVPTVFVVSGNGMAIEKRTYEFGEFDQDSDKWRFFDASEINADDVKLYFPDFPDGITFPTTSDRSYRLETEQSSLENQD